MNKPITYIIADDDDLYRQVTIQQLLMIPNMHCLAECKNAIDVKSKLEAFNPDLLLLDIEMPGLSGIQLARSMKNLPLVIFITSHISYAAEAFEVDAIDYLVKPVASERLIRAIDKAAMLIEMKRSFNLQDSVKVTGDDHFFIRENNTFVKIPYAEVLYIESLGDFISIYLQHGEKKIALVSLKNIEQQLPHSKFIRISRTHMVNKDKVTALESSSLCLGKTQLSIGKTYADAVLQVVMGNNIIKRFL